MLKEYAGFNLMVKHGDDDFEKAVIETLIKNKNTIKNKIKVMLPSPNLDEFTQLF